MALIHPRCPVASREQAWIEKMLLWCVERFGEAPLSGRVVEPTAEFLPPGYRGTEQDVLLVVELVRAHLGIDPARFTVRAVGDPDIASRPGSLLAVHAIRSTVAAGHYQQSGGKGHIRIDLAQARDPRRLAAVAAHELCHELLLGDGGIDGADGADHEPLTDLLTVYLGLGIFGANAAFEFESSAIGWRARTLGYLTEPMFGYALACYAWMRGEPEPAWARYLDNNPRGYLRKGSKYLAQYVGSTGLAGFKAGR
jgi:hypothetical protein